MRVTGNGIVPVAKQVELTFNGSPLTAYEGETVAAALSAAGLMALRHTKDGKRRGIFCGMGVCHECLVAIDGQQNFRACMTTVRPGMKVEEQTYPGKLPGPDVPYLAEPSEGEMTVHRPDVLIIGGGPAGLQAARAAATAGASVMLVDERPALGGQYFKQLSKTHKFADEAAMDKQFRAGRDLIVAVEKLGVKIFREAMVWGAFSPQEIAVYVDGQSILFEPKQLVIATGAYERGVPVPGWTMPGYMTTGAAQTLMRSYRVSPGKKVFFAGNGPLNLQVACELAAAGVKVVGLAEAARAPSLANVGDLIKGWTNAPDLMLDGLGYLWKARKAGIPMFYGHVVVEAKGDGKVETVVIAEIDDQGRPKPGTQREIACDAVCVGMGFQPSADVSRPLGCKHRFDEEKGTLVIETDANRETSVKSVFVAGDSGGMGGSRAAQEEGFIAGCQAARNLGRTLPSEIASELERRRGHLGKHRAFQAALWNLFKAPRIMEELATDQTYVCRCEEVTLGRLKEAIAEGISTVGGVKRLTRCGMGRCQARYCGPVLTHMMSENRHEPIDEFSFFAPRPPIKPVPIAAIARKPAD